MLRIEAYCGGEAGKLSGQRCLAQFRGHILGCAIGWAENTVTSFRKAASDTKVGQTNSAVFHPQHVIGLHIAVYQAEAMQMP